MDSFVSASFEPITKLINRNEETLTNLTQAERNLGQLSELTRQIDEKYIRFGKISQQFDLIFEEEQIKQQVKESGKKVSKSTNSKMTKTREKVKEEESAYKFSVDQYNLHSGKLLQANVGWI